MFTLPPRSLKTEVSLWKPIKCIPFTLTTEKFKDQTIIGCFRFAFEKDSKCSLLIRKPKAGVFKSSGLKRVFEVLRFRDGSVWTVGLTVEIYEVAFSNSSSVMCHSLKQILQVFKFLFFFLGNEYALGLSFVQFWFSRILLEENRYREHYN